MVILVLSACTCRTVDLRLLLQYAGVAPMKSSNDDDSNLQKCEITALHFSSFTCSLQFVILI
jgi:hypothetical protein